MVTFKFNGEFYTAYKANEFGNPHQKKYPCLLKLDGEEIPMGEQRPLLMAFFKEKGLDYHDVIKYEEKDINTHDLVKAVIKFHDMKKL